MFKHVFLSAAGPLRALSAVRRIRSICIVFPGRVLANSWLIGVFLCTFGAVCDAVALWPIRIHGEPGKCSWRSPGTVVIRAAALKFRSLSLPDVGSSMCFDRRYARLPGGLCNFALPLVLFDCDLDVF